MGTDIVRQLMTRGTFVVLRSGRPGMVRRFDRRTNEALVQFGATGLVDALAGPNGLSDDMLRHEGLASDHHFTTLRLAPKAVVDQLEGRT